LTVSSRHAPSGINLLYYIMIAIIRLWLK